MTANTLTVPLTDVQLVLAMLRHTPERLTTKDAHLALGKAVTKFLSSEKLAGWDHCVSVATRLNREMAAPAATDPRTRDALDMRKLKRRYAPPPAKTDL